MTENEAFKMWCPMVRYTSSEVSVEFPHEWALRNRPTTAVCCVASRCMAWRWSFLSDEDEKDQGYCGLAGKP